MGQEVFFVGALAVACIAVYTDTRYGLVFNKLTLPTTALGILGHGIFGSWDGLVFALAGAGIGLSLFLIPFLIGGMGAGDVKLLAALGALVGPQHVFATFLFSATLGGVTALVVLVRRYGLPFVSTSLLSDRGALLARDPETGTRMTAFPFGSAIFFGLFASNLVS